MIPPNGPLWGEGGDILIRNFFDKYSPLNIIDVSIRYLTSKEENNLSLQDQTIVNKKSVFLKH